MTVEGIISEGEFSRLNVLLFFRKPAIALLLLAVFGLGLFWSTRSGGGNEGIFFFLAPLLIPVGLGLMVAHNARGKYRASRMLRAHVRYTLTPEGVAMETSDARAVLPWGQVAETQQTPRHLMIYSDKKQAFLVGKGWFHSAESLRAFTDALERRSLEGPSSQGC